MDIIFYDIEVFRFDFTITFKSLRKGEYWFFHNDNYGICEFMRENSNNVFCGFNNKFYDDHVLNAILHGADNNMVKNINDWIIRGNLPWEHPFLQGKWRNFKSFDVRDDLRIGLSLKEIEGNLGMNIEESQVDFNINRALTPKEIEEIEFYNKHDVDATERLFHKRKRGYLKPKADIGKLVGLPSYKSLGMTNGKLTAKVLKAKKKERNDERSYVPPKVIDYNRIPKPVLQFFSRMYDTTISDDELFYGVVMEDGKKTLPRTEFLNKQGEVTHYYLGGRLYFSDEFLEYVYAWGGVHGAIPRYTEKATDDRVILLWDVNSLYPSIMIEYDFLSRNVENPEDFKEMYKVRMKAKAEGNKAVSDSRKLVLNTSYGVMLNKHNDMYDPLMGRSVCITGQLVMTDLLWGLKKACTTLKPINFNTDGIMFSVDRYELDKAIGVAKEWQERTGLGLGEDVISQVIQKDVNNYIMQTTDGKVVTVGPMVKLYHGSLLDSNSVRITHIALVDYLLYGIPVEETVAKNNDLFLYQFIAKTGSTYLKTYHEVNGELVEVQKVNRVYATKDKRYGTVYKYKINKKTGKPQYDKIANLPKHCIIDNNNKMTLDQIDKQFYIDLIYKRIKQFTGGKRNDRNKRSKTK